MGQKIHPLGLRIGITQQHRSQWFAKTNQYSTYILEDFFIRKNINEKFRDAGISTIEIHRKLDQIKIELCCARPGIIVGREGNGLETLQKELAENVRNHRFQNLPFATLSEKEQFLLKNKSIQIAIQVIELASPDCDASFLAEFMVEQLEKRVPFRRAVRQAIQRAQRVQIKGIKIQISGRLNGAEIARSEWVREGRVPLQTLRADIDYSYKTAKTIYGILGIKVWLFKGEIR